MPSLKKVILLIFITVSVLAQDTVVVNLELREKQLPFGLMSYEPAAMPKIGLALSGGGSRAISQIGILKALEANSIPVDYIAGTSMGSIIGGLYASGYCLDQIDSIITSTNWNEFTSINETSRKDLFVDEKITEDRAIFSIRFDGLNPVIPTSINTGQKVLNFLNLLFINAPLRPGKDFEQLLYNFRAVATDLVDGGTVVLKDGSISKALRASSSVSFLLPPVKMDSLYLVDGGLVANIPVDVARDAGSDIVIAVNTTSPLRDMDELSYPWTIADQIVSIPIAILTQRQTEDADVVVQPYLGTLKNNDFSNLQNIIELGAGALNPHLNSIERKRKKLFESRLNDQAVYFRHLYPSADDTMCASIIDKFSGTDSLSSHDIAYCLSKEFMTGKYKNLSASIIKEQKGWKLEIDRKFNPEIKTVEINGSSVFDRNYLASKFKNQINKPFKPVSVLQGILQVLRGYKKRGITLAEVKDVLFNESAGKLIINIDEGIIDEIRISGNEKTDTAVIERELPFRTGSVLSYNELREGLENLRTTNLFDEVNLEILKENNKNTVSIYVDEKLSAVFRFGLKIDNEYFTQFLFDLRDENLLGSGTEIGANFFSGPRNRYLTFEQKSSRIFNSYLTYSLKAFYSSVDINTYSDIITQNERRFKRDKTGEYKQRNYGLSLGLGAQVLKFGNVYGELRYARDEIENGLNNPVNEYLVNLSTLRFGFKIDSQDKYPFATNGFLIESYYETAQRLFSSEISYSKFYFDYNQYFTINSVHTFHFSGMIGFGDETLPLSQQFSFGGQELFSGYREYEFRGRQIFITSVEYRLMLPWSLFFDTYVKFNYDLGSVWRMKEAIKFEDLRHGLGATISFDTPVGPADFSVAKSLLIKKQLPKSIISWGETLFYFNIGFYY
ncbi:MAG: patatin-like phospholipase family protein [Melioribacteraceae bacterium]|nr:patatin-like phospholipase family protein [Melioribacteraceae bacterium]